MSYDDVCENVKIWQVSVQISIVGLNTLMLARNVGYIGCFAETPAIEVKLVLKMRNKESGINFKN